MTQKQLAGTVLAIDIKYHSYIDDIKIACSNCELSIEYRLSNNKALFNLNDNDLKKIVNYFRYYNFECYFLKINGAKIFDIGWNE